MNSDDLEAAMAGLVAVHRAGLSGDELGEAAHQILLRIRPNHGDALEMVAALPPSDDAAETAARADVLGEVCNGDPQYVDRVLPMLAAMAESEERSDVLQSIIHALDRLWDPRTTPTLVRWATHPDDELRRGVAAALHGVTASDDGKAVDALIALSRDPSAPVRDWATFALGGIEQSGSLVDQALRERIDDDDECTRAEAFMALAERGDDRIVEPLIEVLRGGSVGPLEIRAASKLADVRLHPILLDLASQWGDADREALERAVERCDPSLQSRTAEIERELLREIHVQLERRGLGQVAVTVEGAYPDSEFVLDLDGRTSRWDLWSYDDESPTSLDREFTVRRVVNVAASMVDDGGPGTEKPAQSSAAGVELTTPSKRPKSVS